MDHLGAGAHRAGSVPALQQQNGLEEGVPRVADRGLDACMTPRSATRLVAARPLLAPGEISRGEWIAPHPGWPSSRRQAALRRLTFGEYRVTTAVCAVAGVIFRGT